jgi:hypothetical protein
MKPILFLLLLFFICQGEITLVFVNSVLYTDMHKDYSGKGFYFESVSANVNDYKEPSEKHYIISHDKNTYYAVCFYAKIISETDKLNFEYFLFNTFNNKTFFNTLDKNSLFFKYNRIVILSSAPFFDSNISKETFKYEDMIKHKAFRAFYDDNYEIPTSCSEHANDAWNTRELDIITILQTIDNRIKAP